jgi:hypothetical protein
MRNYGIDKIKNIRSFAMLNLKKKEKCIESGHMAWILHKTS